MYTENSTSSRWDKQQSGTSLSSDGGNERAKKEKGPKDVSRCILLGPKNPKIGCNVSVRENSLSIVASPLRNWKRIDANCPPDSIVRTLLHVSSRGPADAVVAVFFQTNNGTKAVLVVVLGVSGAANSLVTQENLKGSFSRISRDHDDIVDIRGALGSATASDPTSCLPLAQQSTRLNSSSCPISVCQKTLMRRMEPVAETFNAKESKRYHGHGPNRRRTRGMRRAGSGIGSQDADPET